MNKSGKIGRCQGPARWIGITVVCAAFSAFIGAMALHGEATGFRPASYLLASESGHLRERLGQWTTVRGRVTAAHEMASDGTHACKFGEAENGFQAVLVGPAGARGKQVVGRVVEVAGYVDLSGEAPRIYLYEAAQLTCLD